MMYAVIACGACVWLVFARRHRWTYAASLLFTVVSGSLSVLGSRGILPTILLVGLPAAIVRMLRRRTVFDGLLFLFVTMVLVGTFRVGVESASVAWVYFHGYLLGVAFSIVLGTFIDTWKAYDSVLKVGILGSVFSVAWNVLYLGSKNPATIAVYQHGRLLMAERPLAQHLDPNHYAMILIVPFSVALVLFIRLLSQGKLGRAFLWALVSSTSCAGVLYSLSRAGLIGLIIAGALALLDEGGVIPGRTVRGGRLIKVFVVLSIVGLVIAAPWLSAELESLGWGVRAATAGDSWATRLDLWQSGLTFVTADPSRLVFGGGLARVYEVVGDVVHNSYLQVLDDMGLLGFGSFVGLITASLQSLWQARRNETSDVAVGVFWGCVAQLITLFTISAAHLYITWAVVGLGFASSRLCRIQRLRTRRSVGGGKSDGTIRALATPRTSGGNV